MKKHWEGKEINLLVIFSFDEPKRAESTNHSVRFTDLNVLDFNFKAIQLNRLSWRDFLTQSNPVAAALMSKMNIPLRNLHPSPVPVGEFKIQSGDRYKPEVKSCLNLCIPLLSSLTSDRR